MTTPAREQGDGRDDAWRPAYHYSQECGQWCLVASDHTGQILVAPYRCGSWVCQRGCGHQRGMQWFARALTGVEALGAMRTKFVTMTLDPARWRNALAGWQTLGACWNRWRTSSRREWGPYEYLRVVELHKSGWPHIHALLGVDAYMPHARVQALAVRAGFGRIIDIRQAWRAKARQGGVTGPADLAGGEAETRRAVARYVSKYLIKQAYHMPVGIRRANCSRGWGAPLWIEPTRAPSELTWELVRQHPDIVGDAYLRDHYDVRRLDLGMSEPGD